MKPSKRQVADGIDCIVVGGAANGTVLKKIRADAQFIELSRPEYIKPLKSSYQSTPDVVNESDEYEVHPIGLRNTNSPQQTLFAIAVVKGKSLTWGFTQLVVGYVENETQKLVAEGIIKPN